MPAISVYGIATGDTLIHPEHGDVRVDTFELSGPSVSPWNAIVTRASDGVELTIPAKELKDMEKQ